jgi:purine-nucleoside phosphorylase
LTIAESPTAAAETTRYLREAVSVTPRVMIVLGSGLGALGDQIEGAVRIPFGEIPGFAASAVEGHKGMFVAGKLEGVDVVALQGRFHLYEGHSAEMAALPIRAMAALGARTLIVTNAAGALNPAFPAGMLMIIDDHINMMWRNPLFGPVEPGETRFPDMSRPYDAELQQIAERVALEHAIPVTRGVYLAVLGPSYETPAEIRMFRKFGGDAVGMSTIPEVITARALGVRVLGVSLITNPAAGSTGIPLTHDEVIEAGREASGRFTTLVRGIVKHLA